MRDMIGNRVHIGNAWIFWFFVLLTSICVAQPDTPQSPSQHTTSASIKDTYHPDIVVVTRQGMTQQYQSILPYLQELYTDQEVATNFESHYRVAVNDKLDYEIGTSKGYKGKAYTQAIIWEKKNEVYQKIFEVIFQKTVHDKVPEGITQAREKWMQLCNSHNAKNLVTQLYTTNAIYYNRGRVLEGRERITQEYTYMNQPSYNLELRPEHVEVVDDETVFEIGRCSGSYPLPYLIVWKKQKDGNWQVYIDSNY